jgi:endonuclease/exonuclease/phosphatase family metal-dependent hydrolase
LLLAYLAYYVSPEQSSFLPFFGLAYPVIVLANLVFIVIWLLSRWKWALLSLLTILLGWNQITTHVQFSKEHAFAADEKKTKVLSYNVRIFDLYNYTKDWKPQYEKRNKIFAFVKEENPDILCFQEFVNDLSGVFKTKDTLEKFLDAKNVHAEYTVTSKDINQFGIATFTVYPIVGKGRINFPNSPTNICIFTDVLIGKDTVRIYNAHFESIHFSQKDYEYTKNVTDLKPGDNTKYRSKRIIGLLRLAFVDRASQVRLVEKHISTCRFPVIVCTDLNDTPCSYAYHHVSGDMKDAFTESGNGFGHTYAGIFPSFRIDYIFHSKNLKAYNFRNVEVDYSDHHPIACEIVKNIK